jgi:hypothetical protein
MLKQLHSLSNSTFNLLLLMFILLTMAACEKKSNDIDIEMAPDNWLKNSYTGTLTVRNTNVYPEWDVSTNMNVEIEKELGTVTISSATLNYSGETIISESSKIERSGSWSLNPIGRLEGNTDNPSVYVDAAIVVQNDVQNIYAKNNSGNWQLVNSLDFSGETPASDLSFNLNEAITSGATISASGDGGSITWTLILVVALD